MTRRKMAGYDTGTLTISREREREITFGVEPQHDILRLTAPNLNEGMLGPMDAFDHDLGFEGEVGGLLYVSLPFLRSLEENGWSALESSLEHALYGFLSFAGCALAASLELVVRWS
jgi:hypothetical protein